MSTNEEMRQFDLTINGEALEVYKFDAVESMFSCFTVNVTLVSHTEMALSGYIGQEALFTILGKDIDRYFHGIVSQFTRQAEYGRYYLYQATIVPLLWKLNLVSDVRIFQNMTTRQIVEQVLNENTILSNTYEFRDHDTYTPREYCVQHRETSLDFISRILAEDGMFYYFEFTESSHKLIFGDMYACHKDIPGDPALLFSEPGRLINDNEDREHVTALNYFTQVTSGKITLKDYRFKIPSYDPIGEKTADKYGFLEQYDYPGYLSSEANETLHAKVRMERAVQEQEAARGTGVCLRFTPGHTFTLTGHFSDELNQEYILTRVAHKGTQPMALQELADTSESNTYGNTFACILGTTSFKPARPAKPSVSGIQTAVVTGPAGEEIHVDEFGRIKVQFHWDRLGQKDENSSCWLRVAQPWAGSGWGAVCIPRIGQEVIVSFIDGDPDRPVVTGALYNGANMPPYSLPADKTKTTFKSNSTLGGGGFNEFRFEDKKGAEEIYIHGQKDETIQINNDKNQTVGHDETLSVGNNRTKTVGVDQSETVGNNKTITVTANHTETVGSNMDLTVGANLTEKVIGSQKTSVTQTKTETVTLASTETIGAAKALTVGGAYQITVVGAMNSTVGISKSEQVVLGKSSKVGKTYAITAGESFEITCGESKLIMKKNGDITLSGVKIDITGSDRIDLN